MKEEHVNLVTSRRSMQSEVCVCGETTVCREARTAPKTRGDSVYIKLEDE